MSRSAFLRRGTRPSENLGGRHETFLGRTGAGREDTFELDPFGMGYCAGLVRGVANTAHTHMTDQVCVPEDASSAQAVWAVVQYLNNNPLTLSDQDTELVLRAMQSAFPCR